MLWSILRIPQPVILSKSVSYLGNMATPLSLIALGASFQWQDAKGKLPATLGITATKLLLFCALFLPLAVAFGFRTEKLIAILVMLGSATTGSCFVMARNMGHRGTLTACSVMMTTLCSAFTLNDVAIYFADAAIHLNKIKNRMKIKTKSAAVRNRYDCRFCYKN